MASTSPLVSVIIPIYNVESYLAQCLDSVLGQSYKNIEVICIDDGSTDSSGAIAQQYASKDSRIHFFTQANAGQSTARNKGLDNATGEYVAFIDSDDYIDREFIKELVEHSSNATLAYNFNVAFEYPHATSRFNLARAFTGISPIDQALISKLDFFVCNGLFSMQIIRAYHLRFLEDKICEDADFLFRYLAFMESMSCFDLSAYHYRQRPHSTTWQLAQNAVVSMDRIYAFSNIVQWYKTHNKSLQALPFQILTDLHPTHHNADTFMTQAHQMVQNLQIPRDLIAKDPTMRAFMTAKNAKDFLLLRSMLARSGLKRLFKLRIRRDECICVAFGYVLINYKRSNDEKN